MGIFGAVYGRVRGVELCKNGHDRLLFAELLLQGDGAGLREDRPPEHALPRSLVLPFEEFGGDRSGDRKGAQGEEELQRKGICKMVMLGLLAFGTMLVLYAAIAFVIFGIAWVGITEGVGKALERRKSK